MHATATYLHNIPVSDINFGIDHTNICQTYTDFRSETHLQLGQSNQYFITSILRVQIS
jgi:hypothetical protein